MPDPNDATTSVSPQVSLAITGGQVPANPRVPAPQQQDLTPPNIGEPQTPTLLPQQPPPKPPTAADAVNQHHNLLGRVASALLGKQVDYRVNPQTGQQEAYEVPQRPGDLFRHILAGALIGGAAAKGTNSVLAGFSRGGAASIQANQAEDEQRRARAQQDFANKQVVDKAAQEKLQATAQHEHWNKEELLHERDANLRDSEFLERRNERAEELQKWALEAGGIGAPIEGNGELGNGKKFEQLFVRDPQKFRPPTGYDRLITHSTDLSGLARDATKGWVDADGNAVNLEDRTTWRVSFVPQKPQPVDVDGAKLNRLFPKTLGGLANPKQTYKMPWHQIVALGTNEHETTRKDDDEDRKKVREDRLKKTSDRDQNRKDVDEKRKQQIADQKLNQQKPVKIGSIGIVDGKRVMVTKVDASGNPTAGVPAP